jgi:hypothetical protein
MLVCRFRPGHAVFALGTYAVMTAVFAISVALYDRAAPPTSAQIPADALKRFAVASDGSYSQYLSANVTDYLAMLGAAAFVLPFVLGMFLLGALAARQGWLTRPARHARLWRRAAWLGAVMLPLAAGLGWAAFESLRQWPELLGGMPFVALSLTFPIAGLYLALIVSAQRSAAQRILVLPVLVLLMLTGGYHQAAPLLFPMLLLITVARLEEARPG